MEGHRGSHRWPMTHSESFWWVSDISTGRRAQSGIVLSHAVAAQWKGRLILPKKQHFLIFAVLLC